MNNVDAIKSYLQNALIREESVYFLDIERVNTLYSTWNKNFPNIHPHYAVKCNSNKKLLQRLSDLGSNFDCASMAEINAVLNLGVSPSRIIFANPCKRKKDIIAAHKKGINVVTFDTDCELHKICEVCPSMKCIFRIYAHDSTARCQLSNKFGCHQEDWHNIFTTAKNLDIDIIGISFHVGSGAKSASAYTLAIKNARMCYNVAFEYGYKLHIIDIGGGFTSEMLGDIPSTIIDALNEYFPDSLGCTYIAEPGRFFAETIGYLATNIIGIRKSYTTREYWITDSIYGSFNCILYDKYMPPILTELLHKSKNNYKTIIYGPTCDGLDKIIEIDSFPEQSLGNWIIFKNMGAYTLEGACNFNGIPFVDVEVVYI